MVVTICRRIKILGDPPTHLENSLGVIRHECEANDVKEPLLSL
jgi:hypothetical protein